jgi:hypothetical protein
VPANQGDGSFTPTTGHYLESRGGRFGYRSGRSTDWIKVKNLESHSDGARRRDSRRTADFNGDGKGDILWQDTSGNLAMWLMNGPAVSSSGGVGNVPSVWSIVGTGDYDGDGNADLLWRDSAGNTAIWFMNGAQVSSSASIGNVPTTWSVVGTGDFNGDGKADIVWRDTGGDG